MKVLSHDEKTSLQAELTALLTKYQQDYGYLCACTKQGVFSVIESSKVSCQMKQMAQITLETVIDMGALPAPSISDN